jgi:N-methylhydantoinase B
MFELTGRRATAPASEKRESLRPGIFLRQPASSSRLFFSMPRDPIELEVFKNLFHSIAEEMGAALRRTAFSPNIKERRDYSCAIFDRDGEVISMGDHMPVHLGSMPMSVHAAITHCDLQPGDMVMLNDPFAGGTHLPDITLVAPVYVEAGRNRSAEREARLANSHIGKAEAARRTSKSGTRVPRAASRRFESEGLISPTPFRKLERRSREPDFYVSSRAHHADVGGAYPGSMGPAREIYQEGFRISPVKLVRAGRIDRDILALLLANVRTPDEREGDLSAQMAACHTGDARLGDLCSRYGLARVRRAAADLLDYSEVLMRAFLQQVPSGTYHAEDALDNDGVSDSRVRIAVNITFKARERRNKSKSRSAPRSRGRGDAVLVDFSGSDPQVQGSINAVEAITYSACFYVFRCLLAEDIPATAGLMRPIRVFAPEGTVVNARPPAAVAGGNVETSQRIVDVLLRALAQAVPDRIPAAASGTMNNLTIGGIDPRTGQPFAYYETIAGAMGGRPGKDGISGVHTHMTNSLNTPAEALEYAYPFRVTQYSLRKRSGGSGEFRGGDGVIREVEVLSDAEVTLLADRRENGPYGLSGGSSGRSGTAEIIRRDGTVEKLPGKFNVRLQTGDRIRIESPGAGGWGKP